MDSKKSHSKRTSRISPRTKKEQKLLTEKTKRDIDEAIKQGKLKKLGERKLFYSKDSSV